MLFSHEHFRVILKKYGIISLTIGILLSAVHLTLQWVPSFQEFYSTWPFDLRGFCAWFIVLGLLGTGERYLNTSGKFLEYGNEAVLPFYILHQPFILIIGYFVIPMAINMAAKYFIIVFTAFVTIMAVYELLVRRFNPVRYVFGMKKKTVLLQKG
jgi:glucan biosynthesis protein C